MTRTSTSDLPPSSPRPIPPGPSPNKCRRARREEGREGEREGGGEGNQDTTYRRLKHPIDDSHEHPNASSIQPSPHPSRSISQQMQEGPEGGMKGGRGAAGGRGREGEGSEEEGEEEGGGLGTEGGQAMPAQ